MSLIAADSPASLFGHPLWLQGGAGLLEAEAQRLFQQVVSALVYCQRRHVCHRDLKPENILLDTNNNAKVADFGLASIVAPGAQVRSPAAEL